MSQLRRLTRISSTTAIGIAVSGSLLFLLYVYPSPDGIVFDGARLVIIVLLGYLFYQLYPGGTDRKKDRNKDAKRATWRSLSLGTLMLSDEEESQFETSVESVLELLTSAYPTLTACAYLKNRSGSSLVRRCVVGERDSLQPLLSLDDPRTADLMKSEKPRFITPDRDEDFISTFFENSRNLPSSTAVSVFPISMEGDSVGLLLVWANQFSDFDESFQHAIVAFSELIGIQLSQFRLISDLRSDIHFYSHLHAFENTLDISRSQDELLLSAVRFCEANFAFDKLTISFFDEIDPDMGIIRTVSGFTMDIGLGDRYTLADSIHGSVMVEGEPLRIDNLGEYLTGEKGRFSKNDMEEYQFLSFLGCPIKNSSDVIGALALESFTSRKYTDTDMKTLQIICQRLGILVDWWKNYNAVRETATRDGLTGLFNHKFFLERFEEEINRASRYGENLVLLMLDLDKFKRVNDSFGHLYGDFVLAETAQRLRKSVRNIDIVARYGGEEFAVILLNAKKENTVSSCRRIVESVGTREYEKDGISVHITISAGVAEFSADGETIRELIGRADEAMYQVKKRGGNDVGLAGEATADS